MASNPALIGALNYADEASWADSSSVVFDERLPIQNSVNDIIAGLEQSKINVDGTRQYQNDGALEASGVYGGTFNVELFLSGHGSTAAGAISATDVPTFLGRCVGTLNTALDGGTVGTQTDVDTFTATGATIPDGALIRIGAIDDARGNGQWVAVSDGSGPVELLTATDAAVAVADVVYGAEIVHPNEGTTAPTVTSMRFNILSSNAQFNAWGAFCSGPIVFSGFNAGELPRCSVPITVSQWASESAAANPSVTSVDEFTPAPVAAGSFFIQDFDTTTRQLKSVRDVEFTIDHQVVPQYAPGADEAHTICGGAVRVKCQPSISFTIDSEAAGTQFLTDLWDGTTWQHVLYSLSCTDGSAMGLYMPRCKPVGPKPTQFDSDGLNRVRITLVGIPSTATTTELEHCSWRLAFG